MSRKTRLKIDGAESEDHHDASVGVGGGHYVATSLRRYTVRPRTCTDNAQSVACTCTQPTVARSST